MCERSQEFFLQPVDALIQDCGHQAQDDDGGHQRIHLKYLAGVDDQVSQTGTAGEKLTDDDTYQTQADVYLHAADD